MIRDSIEQAIQKVLAGLEIEVETIVLEHPTDLSHGDYATSIALSAAKKAGKSPKALAEEIKIELEKELPQGVERVEVAGPGFINFYLSREFFAQSVGGVIEKGSEFGKNANLAGEKVMVEYTDANPFKEFHIGHLMSNTIGESVSRLFAWNGAEVKRACYQGDVGMHVAKAVWGMEKGAAEPYAAGAKAYEESEDAKLEIREINQKIYSKSDKEINELYERGRSASLAAFDRIYQKLGTAFDFFFFESETAEPGKKIVLEHPGVFVESDGAIVFNAAEYDPALHTRVFINSDGLPTYEAKELGLAGLKAERYPYTRSIVVTANEINDYFRVLLAAMRIVAPDLATKTAHLSHGVMRLSTGKMSSRTGDVITAESLIEEVKEKTKGEEAVAIGAIKYMILRQAVGGDIIFDVEKSVSTEGDSGVYLQYAHARACSILEKAGKPGDAKGEAGEVREVEKLLYRFPEVVARALAEFAPHYIVTYLTEVAGSFNNFYAHEQVLNNEPESAYRLAIVEAFKNVMKNGLEILGIPAPEKM